MSTINAQSIINEAMAAHAIAPDYATDTIKFKTSARGSHTVLNCKKNLMRFAEAVRKNAAVFGGGLIREEKTKPAIVWPSKTIALWKQCIDDGNYQAAFDIGTEKLGALFYIGTDGKAHMQVAPVPMEQDKRFISILQETGTCVIIEPVSMFAVPGPYKNKRSRDAQIENVMHRYSNLSDEQKETIFSKAYATPTDQAAARAQWAHEHGIVDI